MNIIFDKINKQEETSNKECKALMYVYLADKRKQVLSLDGKKYVKKERLS